MTAHLLLYVLLALSLFFSLLTLLGQINPRLGLARDRRTSLRRNGTLALVGYAFMAIVLSAGDIERRGYDRGYRIAAPYAASNGTVQRFAQHDAAHRSARQP